MTNKIQLTRVQANDVKRFKEFGHSLAAFALSRESFGDFYESLHNLTLDEMARALYEPGSYELAFVLGDLLTVINTQYTFRLIEHIRSEEGYVVDKDGKMHLLSSLRHATAEEKFWFDMGRKFLEVREGDVVLSTDDELTDTREHVKQIVREGFKYYYPVEARLELPQEHNNGGVTDEGVN